MSSALFGRQVGGLGSTGGNKHFIEVKAGKMFMKDNMVYPDLRKGLLFLYRSDDSLVHFCWRECDSAHVEDDLIIFPDECEFVKVNKGAEKNRVYSLKFKTSKRIFYWIQELKSDKDEEFCKKINQFLNNPSSVAMPGNSGSSSSHSVTDWQSLFNNMTHSQLLQFFSDQGEGLSNLIGNSNMSSLPALLDRSNRSSSSSSSSSSSTTMPSTPSVTPASVQSSSGMSTPKSSSSASGAVPSNRAASQTKSSSSSSRTTGAGSALAHLSSTPASSAIQMSDLQHFLRNIQSTSASGESKELKVDLVSSFQLDSLNDFLKRNDVKEHLKSFLPKIDDESASASENQIASTISCPQFKQALSQFSNALQSGHLGPVIAKMNMSAAAVTAANRGSLREFVEALEATSTESTTTTSGSEAAKVATEPMDEDAVASTTAAAATATKKPDSKSSG